MVSAVCAKAATALDGHGEQQHDARQPLRGPHRTGDGSVLDLHGVRSLRRAQILFRSIVRLHRKNMHTLIAENLALHQGKIDSTGPRPPRPNSGVPGDRSLSLGLKNYRLTLGSQSFPSHNLPAAHSARSQGRIPFLESISQSTGIRRLAMPVHPLHLAICPLEPDYTAQDTQDWSCHGLNSRDRRSSGSSVSTGAFWDAHHPLRLSATIVVLPWIFGPDLRQCGIRP